MAPKTETTAIKNRTPQTTPLPLSQEITRAVLNPKSTVDPVELALRRGAIRPFEVTTPFDLWQRGRIHESIAFALTAEYLRVQRHLTRYKGKSPCVVYQATQKSEKKAVEKAVRAWLKDSQTPNTYVAIQRRSKITLLNPRGKEIKRNLSKNKGETATAFWKKEGERREKALKKVLKVRPTFLAEKSPMNLSLSIKDFARAIEWLQKIDQCVIRLNEKQVREVTSCVIKGIFERLSHPSLPVDPERIEPLVKSTDPKISLEEKQAALLKFALHFLDHDFILPQSFSTYAEALMREADICSGRKRLQT